MPPHSDLTLTAILSAAETLFVRQTYGDVSMRDIAEAARLTTGALYHYFPSKEQLYLAMVQADWARKRQAMAGAVTAGGSCRDNLRSLTRVFLAMPPERRDLLRLVRRDINVFNGSTRAAIIQAYQETLPDLVESILCQGMASGELRQADARWLAWVYIALVETTLAPYAESVLGPMEDRLDSVLRQFFFGASSQS